MSKELRYSEIRSTSDQEKMILEGYAIVFDETTVLFRSGDKEYKEVIKSSALDERALKDVALKYNHGDAAKILARTRNGSLELKIDSHGLFIRAEIQETSDGKDIYAMVRSGLLDKMSFAFTVKEEEFESKTLTRTIKKIDRVFEVSIVDQPAYEGTSIYARSFQEIIDREENEERESLYDSIEVLGGKARDFENCSVKELRSAIEKLKTNRSKPKSFNPFQSYGLRSIGSFEMKNKNIKGDDSMNTIFETQEYRNGFYKSLLGHELTAEERSAFDKGMLEAEKRSSSFESISTVASVLPSQTLNQIISKARTIGGLLSVCRRFDIPSKAAVPVATPGSNAAWHTEGEEVQGEKTDITTVNFSGYEIIKVMSLSVSSQKMTISAFEQYIIEELSQSVLGTIAHALVNGTGVEQGTGILAGVKWDSKNAFTYDTTGITYKDILKAPATLKRGYASGASWAMNTTTLYEQVYGLVDGVGRPLFIQDPKTEDIGKILGFQVIIDDNLPTDTILFGNFRYMGYNIPQGLLIEASRQSSFKQGLIDYRALAIADCKPIIDEAFVKFTRL